MKPLLKQDFIPMRNNYFMALRRYKALKERLSKDKHLKDMYSKAMETLIVNKEVEEVKESALEIPDPIRYLNYTPHLAVIKLDKSTTKCRPVFDASARNADGISLNTNLLKGPKTQLSL